MSMNDEGHAAHDTRSFGDHMVLSRARFCPSTKAIRSTWARGQQSSEGRANTGMLSAQWTLLQCGVLFVWTFTCDPDRTAL